MKLITLILLTIFLVSCGGGSKQSNTFSVISHVPANGAKSIEPESTISVTFSEDVLESSIDNDSFTLTNSYGDNVESTVSYNAVTQQAELKPAIRLHLLDTYAVNLSSSIKSIEGNSLNEANWSFAVRDGKWGEEKIITTAKYSSAQGIDPLDGCDDSCTQYSYSDYFYLTTLELSDGLLVVFTTKEGDKKYITVNANGEYSQPKLLPEYFNSDRVFRVGGQRRFVADDKGNGTLIFVDDGDISFNPTYSTYAIQYDKELGWGNSQKIISERARYPFSTSTDGKGNIFVASSSFTSEGLFMNRYTVGSGWEEESHLALSEFRSTIDSMGNTVIAWQESGGLWLQRYVAGSGWSEAENIVPATEEDKSFNFDLINLKDSIMLIWHGKGTRFTWAKRYKADGSGWTNVEFLASGNSYTKVTKLKVPKDTLLLSWAVYNTDSIIYDDIISYTIFDEVNGWGERKENNEDVNLVKYNEGLGILKSLGPANDDEYFRNNDKYDDNDNWWWSERGNTAIDSIGNGVSILATEAFVLDSNGNIPSGGISARYKRVITTRRFTKADGWGTPIEVPLNITDDSSDNNRGFPQFIVDDKTGVMTLVWGAGGFANADIRAIYFE